MTSETLTPLIVPDVTWWKDPGLRRLYAMMPIFFLGSTLTGYDGSLLNGLQTMRPWQDRLGLFSAIQNIGGFCAIFFSAYAADLLGRKKGVALGLVFVFIGTILQCVPITNSSMFLGGRFFVGFGSNFAQGSAPLLITELAHPKHRGPLTTIYNTLWFLGSIVAAWTVYGTVHYTTNASWRIPVALQALLPAIQFILIWTTPESPRWLCSKDRLEEAFAILVKYHANGDRNNTFVEEEFGEIQTTIRLEREISKQGWSVLFRTPGNRKRVLVIVLTTFFSQCSGNSLVSYYLHDILNSVGITGSRDQSVINGGLQIWSFLVAVGMALTVDKLGRRFLFLFAAFGMFVSFTIWTACSAVYAEQGNTKAGSAVIAMIFIFYGVAGFAWPGLTVAYSTEILPYSIRAKGLSICFAAPNTNLLIFGSPSQRLQKSQQLIRLAAATLGLVGMAESSSSQHTGSPDPEIPQQLYTRAPRRPQEDLHHHAPLLSSQNPGGGAPKPRVSDAVQRHIIETQQTAQLWNTITAAFAAAVDQHAEGYTNPREARIAEELQQRVVLALTSLSLSNSPPSSRWSSDTSRSNPGSQESGRRSWADVARDPQISDRGGNRPLNPARFRPGPLAKPKEDNRIFIAISNPTMRLQQPSPFAVRQAVCKSIGGITLKDIPSASPIKTGWAITPANKSIRDQLLTQENQELL
ncbi:hypothetical protein E8E12_000042, partial [Didymella heteroderae]